MSHTNGTTAKVDDSLEEWAGFEFEPVDNDDLLADLSNPAYDKMCRELGISLRLAAVIVGRTKPELVEQVRKVLADGDLFERQTASFDGAAKHLRSLATMLDAATARLLVAAHVVAAGGQQPA